MHSPKIRSQKTNSPKMKNEQNLKIADNDHPTKKEQEEVFNLLTKNAFDFLETGIMEFDDNPKYSIVHFSTAIEMFLKARLAHQDWKLLFSNQDKADWNKFKTGDFHAINTEEANKIIKTTEPNNKLIIDAHISFRSLSNHRNKIIHFYHHGLESSQETKEKIISEYCNSWISLRALLTKQWERAFAKFKRDIKSADCLIKQKRNYLGDKFNRIKHEIESKDPEECPACGYGSLIHDSAMLSKFGLGIRTCAVCDYQKRILDSFDAHCPECGESPLIQHHDQWICRQCKSPIDDIHKSKEYKEKIEKKAYRCIHYNDFPERIDCQTCDGTGTVLRLPTGRDDVTDKDTYLYLCTNCFEISQNCWSCENCGILYLDDGRFREPFGCSSCQSSMFGYRDDD